MKEDIRKFSYLHYDFVCFVISLICIFSAVNLLAFGAVAILIITVQFISTKYLCLLIIMGSFLSYAVLQVNIIEMIYTYFTDKLNNSLKGYRIHSFKEDLI